MGRGARVGHATLVDNVIPVIRVLLGIQLLVCECLANMDLALDNLPSLHVIVHEGLAVTRPHVSARETDLVGGIRLALTECEDVVELALTLSVALAEGHVGRDGVAGRSHGREGRRRHLDGWR